MSILEAMSYGLPVVSTRVGGIPDLVTNEENGYIYDAGDADSMGDAIVKILSDDSLANRMSANNHRKIVDSYSLEVYARQLREIYKETTTL